uniref:RNA transcription, translation and transport factor protein n=1 Tax=Arion vulgaris TaxID=1028688 RepID=A0A0B6ZG48_9EUPU
MFRRKLIALDFQDHDAFDINDENKFRSVILWLEDQKIRHLKIEDREPLRSKQGNEWTASLKEYLSQLNCPYEINDKRALLDWLLGYAIRLEFGDEEKYKNVTAEKHQQRLAQKPGNSTNPLDNLDFEDAEFKAGIMSLATMLQIPPHHDHLDLLKAICITVVEKFSQDALDAALKQKNIKDEFIPLDKTELGFDAGDYILTEAAKILRLIHIRDLRDLQTKINLAIVEVQKITADPKTDSRLGKVGY